MEIFISVNENRINAGGVNLELNENSSKYTIAEELRKKKGESFAEDFLSSFTSSNEESLKFNRQYNFGVFTEEELTKYQADKVVVGLVEGRHPLPVSEYIFTGELTMNFYHLEKVIREFIETKVGVHTHFGMGVNQSEYSDIEVYFGDKALVVYVTGFTPATAALCKVCALNGVDLTLMHYDFASATYKAQRIF